MVERINRTFARLRAAGEGALVTFVTAGDPDPATTPDIVAALAQAGADIVEIGIPYSDPLADGPSIQNSTQRALDRGVTPGQVLTMVREIRRRTDVPVVLMTSYNIVLSYGLTRFATDAAEAGVDGAILTDLPPEEAGPWKTAADMHGIATIFLVAPTSTDARLRSIAASTTGFVYCVSRTGVTGVRADLPEELKALLDRIRAVTDLPVCVGFGISTPAHVAQVTAYSDGAVIGSALVDFLHRHAGDPDLLETAGEIVRAWKSGTRHQEA